MSADPTKTRTHAGESLTADDVLLPFMPELLQDPWSLGFAPASAVALLHRNQRLLHTPSVLDLGCGKGALLTTIASELGWHGYGVDIVPEFIAEARTRARAEGVEAKLRFEIEDLRAVLSRGEQTRLVSYGFDSEILGPL